MNKALAHFITITRHRILVARGCFAVGLYVQGLTHDLSKYAPVEFLQGARYYQGDRSPNNAEREAKGYSEAWMHHKGRNKHHYEYWTDYSAHETKGVFVPVEMPRRYVVEMFMDRIAASKVYKGKDYKDSDPLLYFSKGKDHCIMHPRTKGLLEALLMMLAKYGEEETFAYIKEHVLRQKSLGARLRQRRMRVVVRRAFSRSLKKERMGRAR